MQRYDIQVCVWHAKSVYDVPYAHRFKLAQYVSAKPLCNKHNMASQLI